MTPTERDEEPDAYLNEALRHAPDATLGPPPALSDAILREATRAASAAPPKARSQSHSPASWGGVVWDWLARPSVAAGFASVVAATLVGMMWWDRPLDETLPRPPAADRASSTESIVTPEPSRSRETAPDPGAAAAAQSGEKATASPDRPPSPETAPSTRNAARTESSSKAPRRALPQADENKPRAPAESPQPFPVAPAGAPAQTAPAARAAPPAAAAPPATAVLTTPAAPPAIRSDTPMRNDTPLAGPPRDSGAAAEGRIGDARERASPKLAEEDNLARQERRQAKARADAAGPPAAALQGGARSTALADVRRAIAEAPGRWSWQRGREPARAVDAGLQSWLGEVDAAMARAPTAPGEGSSNAGVGSGKAGGGEPALEVRLLRSGQPRAILRLGANSVSLERPDEPGASRLSVVGPDAIAALKARLAELER